MLAQWKRTLMAVIFAGISSASLAEDIDLFTGVAPSGDGEKPNVLIVLDNTANWTAAFTNEMAALAAVVNGLGEDKFNVGLMMFTETGTGNSTPDGAYVRAALRRMTSVNKPLYANLVNSLHVTGDRSNGGKLGKTMAEAYYYFSAANAYAGGNKIKRDHAGNVSGTTASKAVYALPGNAFASSTSTQYVNPVASGCQKNFIIYISNGAVQDNSSDTALANTKLVAAGGVAAQISISPSGSQSNAGDEWTRFMAITAPTKVVTYTVDVDPITSGQGPGFSALLNSMATEGKGKYFSVNSAVAAGSEIADALNSIFTEIQAVNSVFASASLPVSVNTQGTFLNQIFIGMFRPDGNANPRWNGNLKQYHFIASVSGGALTLNLADAADALAINNSTGFITQCARSFWTPTTVDSYWRFAPQGSCTSIANSANSNSPDGDVVEKGAAGFRLRAINPTARTVKTCGFASCTVLTDFNNANTAITTGQLGAADATERTNIINWSRGMDVQNENNTTASPDTNTTEMRPSAHGDVVHSRPVAVDYGTGTGVVVFYGANDGMLHAINGNQSSSIGTFPPGGELWSFIAPEHYGKLKRIYDNSITITLPSTVGSGTEPKPYFFDGSIKAYKDASAVWVYAAQRRGGRMLYAFDASTATSPTLKWRQGCPNLTNDTGCTTGFDNMGQTWAAAKIIKSAGYVIAGTVGPPATPDIPKPMLIMGGGYDTCEDGTSSSNDLNTCTATIKGDSVFVLDADTGTLLKELSTDRSVVGDITVVTNKITGLVEYAYAVDTGGNVYRITIGSSAPASWTITKIASLGCATPSCPGGVANRKFLFAPEVVVTPNFTAILVGSGDRERPLLANATTTSVDNAFFMIKDKPSDASWWSSETSNCGAALACMDSLLLIDPDSTVIPTQSALDDKKGWYLEFGATGTSHDKEQVVTSAVVVFGTVTFSTHTPTPVTSGTCGNLGLARVYNFNFLNTAPVAGAPRFETIQGGGLAPSPEAGMVTVINSITGLEITVPFIIGANPSSSLEGKAPLPAATTASFKTRAYWYLKK